MPATSESEEAIVRRWLAREPESFDRLVDHFAPDVARLVHRLLGWPGDSAEVDDAVQDVFITVLEKGRGFDGRAAFRTWLTRVTVNHCLSLRRRWQTRRRRLWRWWHDEPIRSGERSDEPAMRREAVAGVWAGLARLRPADRAILVLHHLEESPVAEVAATLGISRAAAEVRLHRARLRLRAVMSEPGGETA